MIALNAMAARAVRLFTSAIGVWFADVDVDLDVLPTGKATLIIGATTLLGTVDARSTGRFGGTTTVRVVGGGAGWDRAVKPIAFHNDFGVLSSEVFAATAAEVGEVVTDTAPLRLGVDYVRTSGAASRVFTGRAWYVDAAGVTVVGSRPPVALATGIDLLTWEPKTRRAELAAEEVILPGTVITDERIGTATVQDVEQTIDGRGARAIAWCSAPTFIPEGSGSRLARALRSAAIEGVQPARLAVYRYKVVLQAADGRCTLQLADKAAGVPEFLPDVPIWPGVPGAGVKPKLTGGVLVAFLDGNLALPAIVGFDSAVPPNEIALPTSSATSTLVATEHAISVEAVANIVGGIFVYLASVSGTPTSLAAALVALSAAPARGVVVAAIMTASAGTSLEDAVKTAIDNALAAKAPNSNGKSPGVGSPGIRVG